MGDRVVFNVDLGFLFVMLLMSEYIGVNDLRFDYDTQEDNAVHFAW